MRALIILLLVLFQSCRTCSHSSVSTEEVGTEHDMVETRGEREVWSTLVEVGLPVIPDTIPARIIERYCYTVSYNPQLRQPNWVMWQLTGEHVMNRKEGVWNEYREDVTLPTKTRATLEDYASSGYDRGHMCPGGDCNWDDEGRDETFLLSNMCPQHPKLNRGDWKEIEIACRKWARKYGGIYIVCGPIFYRKEHETIGYNRIPVPEAFFKVVLCLGGTPKGIGFICKNTEGNRKTDFYVNSISQVERITGYSFFPNIPKNIIKDVKDKASLDDW